MTKFEKWTVTMLKAIGRWWRNRQRNVDLAILWPECLRLAPTVEEARGVFFVHCMNDPAWVDYSIDELEEFVGDLT